jgi:hypothetical protein
MSIGISLIRNQRQRQVAVHGYTFEHDDHHVHGELARAAACYARLAATQQDIPDVTMLPPQDWPFAPDEWHPSANPLHNLERAGALLAAEIDRLYRRDGRDNS